MSKHPRRQFAEGLLPLQQDYLRRVTKYVSDVRRLRELVEQNKLPLQDLQLTLRLTNNLTGSGTTFGFPEISRTARDLHAALQELAESEVNTDFSHRSHNHVLEKILPFEEACVQAMSLPSELLKKQSKQSTYSPKKIVSHRAVFLVAQNSSVFDFLLPELAKRGVRTVFISTTGKLTRQIDATTVPVIIYSEEPALDLVKWFPVQATAGIFLLISPDETFGARLAAVRADIGAYFAPTHGAKKIIEGLEQLAGWNRDPLQKSHVLLVDSDETAAAFYSQSIEQAQIKVSTGSAPQDALTILDAHSIDLTILPFNLPECTGIELSLIMRQLPGYQRGPVIILAAQQDVENIEIKSLAEKNIYFMVKPFTPAQMVAEINMYLNGQPNDQPRW